MLAFFVGFKREFLVALKGIFTSIIEKGLARGGWAYPTAIVPPPQKIPLL